MQPKLLLLWTLRGYCNRSDYNRLQSGVAQLAEQLICNQQVAGSMPVTGFSKGLIMLLQRILNFLKEHNTYSVDTADDSYEYCISCGKLFWVCDGKCEVHELINLIEKEIKA